MKRASAFRRAAQPPKLGILAEVIVPFPLYAPSDFRGPNASKREYRAGRVVELSESLVAVRFKGFPNVVDYSPREAAQFQVTA